jgi:hypothetical protein
MRIMVRRLSGVKDPQRLSAEAEYDLVRRLDEADRIRKAGEQFEEGHHAALMSGAEYLARQRGGPISLKPKALKSCPPKSRTLEPRIFRQLTQCDVMPVLRICEGRLASNKPGLRRLRF